MMHISPDQEIWWSYGILKLNNTIVTTWALIIVMAVSSRLITLRLTSGQQVSRWQCILEIIVIGIRKQIEEVGLGNPRKYIAFLGSLFLFIAVSNLFSIMPGYTPPTASLSTTAALAISVFGSVPFFGIASAGLKNYLRSYLEPVFIMLPFNIISELSRTLALAIRLFGNMMSGVMILSILVAVTPLFFPIVMNVLGLLTGMVQAYIFSILATVYITAATENKVKIKKRHSN